MKRAGLLLALLVRGALELSAASTPVLPPEETPAIPPSAGVALAATSLVVSSGNLELHLARNAGGVQVTSLRDTATGTELQAGSLRLPLFTLVLGNNSQLNADSGWGKVELAAIPGGTSLRWSGAGAVPGLAVVANLLPDSGNSALEWALSVENTSLLPVSRAIFPQFAVADLGSSGRVFLPRGPGEEVLGAWSSAFTYSELYPNGWSASLQVLAAYNGATGLYFAMHDASGATKHIGAYGLPAFKAVKFVFEHLPPGSASSGSSFTLQGRGVWRLLRGDWFDAALVHREWASLQPAMLPPDRAAGSSATPLWMRELGVWTQAAGTDAATIASVQAFARYMGVPTGFHWYTWHAIPFDNDYPHYFPPRAGFAAGVKALQATEPRIRVMPYINGRLWDTRDQGTSDFEYTALAKPATTKDAALAPNTESYGSLEADGSPVKLAVMCPATSLWQSRLRTITLELFKSYGVDGVYLDQIAAAAPKLCYDGGHPHPPGGGRWWVDGYRNLLAGIRNEMPADRMLTSESAVDTFNAGFDGYLVWNWQRNNMVPAFRAIYGGAVQLFGRNYSGGLPRDLSVCQRAGQQLVFGEQLGWAFPGIIYENSAPFLRDCARLRNRLAPYFYAGRMERPPRFTGANPPCTSDWQWQGAATPVTTPSLLTGAFTRPEVQSTILVFANISETTQSGSVSFDGATYDLSGNAVHLRVVRPQATDTAVAQSLAFQKALVLPARSVQAWEIVVAPVEAGAGGGTIPVPADAVPSGNTSNGAGVPAPTPDVGAAPANQAPVVNAGLDLTVTLPSGASLNGSATNDGLPAGNALLYNWNKVSGSGTVTFAAATASATTATFRLQEPTFCASRPTTACFPAATTRW